MLVGMAASGWLIVRSVLVWGVDGDDYVYDIDIPVAAVVVVLWAWVATLLLLPPRTVIARSEGEHTSPALVWPLGKRFRVWHVLAVPIAGLLGTLTPWPIPVALGMNPEIPANLWFGLPLAIVITAYASALLWITLRCALLGVEITPTELIARGYFITRRFQRREIESIDVVRLSGWPNVILYLLTKRDVEYTLQLSLADGSERRLLASNSHEHDVELGAEIVRAWREGLEHSRGERVE